MSDSCAQAQWKFQTGSVDFTIKNAGIEVSGNLAGIKAKVKLNPSKPETAIIEASVEVNSLETGINLRNRHLKKEEYFHVSRYPQIAMKLVSLKSENNGYTGKFTLTMKGISKTIEIPIEFIEIGSTAALKSSFEINRKDFNIGGKSWIMADNVSVKITVQLIKE